MTRRLAPLLIVALAIGLAAGACGGGGKDSETASASSAPEDRRASATEVASGLRKIEGIVKDLADAAGSDKNRATELSAQIEPVWQGIEGTIKENDQDAYVSFEDSFAALEKAAEDGDGAKASKAADDVSATVSSYLATYPG